MKITLSALAIFGALTTASYATELHEQSYDFFDENCKTTAEAPSDLGFVLSQLEDVSKRGFMLKFVDKGYLTEGCVDSVITYYEDQELFSKAASASEFNGLVERAMVNYEKTGNYTKAGIMASNLEMHERSAKNFEESGNVCRAAREAREAELELWAQRLYFNCVDMMRGVGYDDALAWAIEGGLKDYAEELYPLAMRNLEQNKRFFEAYQFSKDMDKDDMATEFLRMGLAYHETNENFRAAKEFALDLGLEDKAKAYQRLTELLK